MQPVHWLIISPILAMIVYNGVLLARELYRSTKRDKTYTLRARVFEPPRKDVDGHDVADNNDDWVTVEINGARVNILRNEQLRRILNG
jgi:hypothetical protein